METTEACSCTWLSKCSPTKHHILAQASSFLGWSILPYFMPSCSFLVTTIIKIVRISRWFNSFIFKIEVSLADSGSDDLGASVLYDDGISSVEIYHNHPLPILVYFRDGSYGSRLRGCKTEIIQVLLFKTYLQYTLHYHQSPDASASNSFSTSISHSACAGALIHTGKPQLWLRIEMFF